MKNDNAPSVEGTPEKRPREARWVWRLVRRLFGCTFGAHYRPEYIDDEDHHGISRGGRCLDCGYAWEPLKWPDPPHRNYPNGIDMTEIIAELRKDPPSPNT
jgi:hypothetical protein